MNMEHTQLTPRRFANFSMSMFAIGLIVIGWGAVDLAMIAPFGTQHVAAIGLGEAVITTISAFLIGIVDSFSGRLAQAEGSGEAGSRLPLLAGAFCLVLVPVAVLLITTAVLASPFLHLIGQNEALIPLASIFISIRLLGAALNLVSTAVLEVLKICGLQNMTVRSLIIGLGLNVFFDYLVLWGPAADWFGSPEAGVATATVVAQVLMGMFAGAVAVREFRRRGDRFVRPTLDAIGREAASIGRVGSGIGLHQVNDYAAATVPFLMMGTLSVRVVAAAAAATKIWTLYCRVPQACFTTSFVFYGYAVGRDRAEARDTIRKLHGYSAAPTLIAAVLVLAVSPWLAKLFGGPSIDVGLSVALLCAFFLALPGYFFSAFYGELLSVRQEGAFLSSRSTIVTYGIALPLAAIAVFVFDSAFLAVASGAIAAAILAVMFANRIRQLSVVDVPQHAP